MPRPGSEWTTITISKKVYEMIRRAMTESNEEAGYRRYRSISHFAEHIFMNVYARDHDQASVFHFRLPSVEETYHADIVEKVIKYEKSEGRKPHDVSDKQRGYDVESVDKKAGKVRYIGVKFGGDESPVALTGREFKVANTLREKYFLYVVVHDDIYIIQNPAEAFSKEENVRAILPLSSLVETGKRVRMS